MGSGKWEVNSQYKGPLLVAGYWLDSHENVQCDYAYKLGDWYLVDRYSKKLEIRRKR